MRKLVCCLVALLLLLLSAQAEGTLITGQITEGALAGSPVYVVTDDSALSGTVGSTALLAHMAEGTLLAGTDRLAVKLSLPRIREQAAALLARLAEQPTYENAVYSSLFIQAQQIELTADEVAALAREAVSFLPMLDADGTLLPRLEGAGGQDTWATVTRYTADERQYPGTWMVQVNVFAPVLPPMRMEIRTDEYGANFVMALSRRDVTDWDETIAALSDAAPGDTSLGQMIKGFTMSDNGASEKWLYVEAYCFGFTLPLRVGMDIYIDAVDARQWTAEFDLINDDTRDTLIHGSLESTPTTQSPDPVESARVIDLTDGMDDDERSALAW